MEEQKFIISLIALGVSVLAIVIPLWVSIYQSKKRYKWDKAIMAYKIGEIWTTETKDHRKVIEKNYGSYLIPYKEMVVPTAEDYEGAKPGTELYDINLAVSSLMNYFENVAVLYMQGVVDKKIIDNTMKKAIIQYHEKIKPLALLSEKVAGYPLWASLDELIEKWANEEKPKTKNIIS